MEFNRVLDFWFDESTKAKWFIKDEQFDQQISDTFSRLHQQAAVGELSAWRDKPRGALAEIILLDQFSRNMYRDNEKAFAFDGLALALAQEALRREDYLSLSDEEFDFLMMPFMHSESLLIHQQAEAYFSLSSNKDVIVFEQKHRDIIERFHRYPHRNEILGRQSTEEERAFLVNNPGF